MRVCVHVWLNMCMVVHAYGCACACMCVWLCLYVHVYVCMVLRVYGFGDMCSLDSPLARGIFIEQHPQIPTVAELPVQTLRLPPTQSCSTVMWNRGHSENTAYSIPPSFLTTSNHH